MNIANDIYYAETDPERQTIPYVKAVDRRGRVTEYFAADSKLTPEEAARLPLRRMDCVDCHNRPSHVFNTPEWAVSRAFETGRLDPSLPWLKREAMRLLAGGQLPPLVHALLALWVPGSPKSRARRANNSIWCSELRLAV